MRRWLPLLAVVLLLGCRQCEEFFAEEEARSPPRPRVAPKDSPQEHREPSPARTSLRHFAGTMDLKNRFSSTVMISLKDPEALQDCSGVLLDARRVLTAGSCVCLPRIHQAPGSWQVRRADAASCARRVFVTSVLYGRVHDPKYPETATEMELHTVQGSVSPHPDMELVLDPSGFVQESKADLALIVLDEAMEPGTPEARLAPEEVRAGEELIMAGYGHDEVVGGFHGVRYFRKNRVVNVQPEKGGRIVYEQQGAYTYRGYDGGPCFREEGGQRWLVGIAGARVGAELVCTSTSTYRDWVLTAR